MAQEGLPQDHEGQVVAARLHVHDARHAVTSECVLDHVHVGGHPDLVHGTVVGQIRPHLSTRYTKADPAANVCP